MASLLSHPVVHSVASACWNDVIARGAMGNLYATAICFGLSLVHRNSSIYDPYWSAATSLMGVFYALAQPELLQTRQWVLLTLVSCYGLRLTISWWARLGHDMLFGDAMVRERHEDWRYVEVRNWPRAGETLNNLIWWGFSSPILIHLYPTVCIFMGCLPMYYALSLPVSQQSGLNGLDLAAALTLAIGILLEGVADYQMDAFLSSPQAANGAVCRQGLWAISRHPNYLGENMVWLGIWLFGVAATSAAFPTAVGFLNIVLLFSTASIPWMERRQASRRPAYKAYQQEVAMVIPYIL